MVRTREPYVVPDTAVDPVQRTDPLVVQDGVRTYAGVPLTTAAGEVLGSVCVLGDTPREYTDQDLAAVRALADGLVDELERRPRAV